MSKLTVLNQQILPIENNEEFLLSLFNVEELEVRLEFIPFNDGCVVVDVACVPGDLACIPGNGACGNGACNNNGVCW